MDVYNYETIHGRKTRSRVGVGIYWVGAQERKIIENENQTEREKFRRDRVVIKNIISLHAKGSTKIGSKFHFNCHQWKRKFPIFCFVSLMRPTNWLLFVWKSDFTVMMVYRKQKRGKKIKSFLRENSLILRISSQIYSPQYSTYLYIMYKEVIGCACTTQIGYISGELCVWLLQQWNR